MVTETPPHELASQRSSSYRSRRGRAIVRWARRFTSPLYLAALAVILVFALLGSGSPTSFFALSLVFSSIYITLALAWDFSSGLTGYLNFGLPFFFGGGAFAVGYLFTYDSHASVAELMLFAFCIGLFGGLLFSLPTLRLRGPYFSLLSFLLPLIGADFVLAFWSSTWLNLRTEGYFGLPFLEATPGAELIVLSVANGVILTVFFVLRSSHFGLILRGIRDDEEALGSQGIRTFPYKVVAFTLSSGVVAFAGAAYAMVNTFAGVDAFGFDFILFPILIVIIGGTGELFGAVFAGYVVILLYQYLFPVFSELTLIVFASAAILLVLFVPHGLVRPLKSFIQFMRTGE